MRFRHQTEPAMAHEIEVAVVVQTKHESTAIMACMTVVAVAVLYEGKP